MASEALEKAIGKAVLSEEFAIRWRQDFDTLTHQLGIPDTENAEALEELNEVMNLWGKRKQSSTVSSTVQAAQPVSDAQRKKNEHVQDFALDTFEKTITSARKTFERVSYMSYVIFSVGITLFVFSAITGLMKDKEVFSIAFGTFGVASFVSFFIFSPSKNVQSALANLIQVEIIFMSFWNQIHFWANYGASSNPELKTQASARMQELTRDLVTILEENIEPANKK